MAGRFLLRAAGIAGALAAAGCTITERSNADGSVERSVSLFAPVTIVKIEPNTTASVRTAGLGAGFAAGTFNLGLYRMSQVQLTPDCHLVMFPSSDQQFVKFASLLKQSPTLCNGGS